MSVSNDLIKHLRQLTGSSITLCKEALEKSDGDIDGAMALLKKSSEAIALKKNARTTGVGIVESYIHNNKKVGVLLELKCETDFVARNPEFQSLAHDLALHIAGMKPLYVGKDKISEEIREEARRLFLEEIKELDKSPEMKEKILAGKLENHFKEVSLLEQPFVKDGNVTIGELINSRIAHFGEKIEVAKFVRFEL